MSQTIQTARGIQDAQKMPEDYYQARAEALTGDAHGFKVRWLSNTYNPKAPNAEMCVVRAFHQTREEAWRHHQDWLKGKIIGDPKATPYYTVEQLKAQNMVGIYTKCEPEELRGEAIDALIDPSSDLYGK